MAHTLFIHMRNEEPFVGEVDQLPQPTDQVLICTNPRRRDGKDVDSFLAEVVTVLIPWHRIAFVEILLTEAAEDIVTFVRE